MKKIVFQITDADVRENVSYALSDAEDIEGELFKTESERVQFISDVTEDIISRAEIYGYDDHFISRLLDPGFYDDAVADALQEIGK